MKRALALPCLAAAFLVACNDSDVQMPIPDGPSALIIDGAHSAAANPYFFFLPPTVGSPPASFPVEFDGEAIPTIEVCRQEKAEGECGDTVWTINPTEVTGAAEHYLGSLKVSDFASNNPNDTEYFQINVLYGNSQSGILTYLGRRDIAVNAPECGDQTASILCVSQDETVPVKFWAGVGAGCFTPGVGIEPRCAFTTVSGQTPSTVSITDPGDNVLTATLTAPGLDPDAEPVFGDQYALRWEIVPFSECNDGTLGLGQELGLEDGGFHSMQWLQHPQCYRLVTAAETGVDADINEALAALVEYTIYFEHDGPAAPAYLDNLRLARMSLDRTELQILRRTDQAGTSSHSQAPSLGTRLLRFARALFDGSLFAPKRVYAASGAGLLLVRDEGVGGLGDGSIVGVVYPALITHDELVDDTVDVGVVAPGDDVPVAVRAEDVDGTAVEGNEVTYLPNSGDRFNSSTGQTDVASGPTGSAGGTWSIASGASGVRTLDASCFPCSDPIVTGDDQSDATTDPDKEHYDDVFPLSAHPIQTITFKAVVLTLSVGDLPSRGLVGEPIELQVCIGASVPNVVVEFAGRANNGTPTEILVDGVPGQHSVNTSDVTFDSPGCFTVDLVVTKEGGLRIIVSIDGTDLMVETNRTNIRPLK